MDGRLYGHKDDLSGLTLALAVSVFSVVEMDAPANNLLGWVKHLHHTQTYTHTHTPHIVAASPYSCFVTLNDKKWMQKCTETLYYKLEFQLPSS